METNLYPVKEDAAKHTHMTRDQYESAYAASVADPNAFWMEEGKRIDWIKPYTKVKNTTYEYPDVSIKWFEDGTLNVTAGFTPVEGNTFRVLDVASFAGGFATL